MSKLGRLAVINERAHLGKRCESEKYAACNECGDEVTVPGIDDENTKELESVCNGLKGCGLL